MSKHNDAKRELSPNDHIDVAFAAFTLLDGSKVDLNDRLKCYLFLERNHRNDYTPDAYDAFVGWAIASAKAALANGYGKVGLVTELYATPFDFAPPPRVPS